MERIEEQAFAKINLYLDVTGKRPDGYHDLVTVMQSVSLCDTLTLTRTAGEGFALDTGDALPADDSNLVTRAANAYFAAAGTRFGVSVRLEKHIPMQAGLGGGSADAAATLRALNTLDNNRFTQEQLCEIGARIGADVPFCVVGGTRLCRGIGERMEHAENNLGATLVLAIGAEGVSTPQAFRALDARYGDFREGRDEPSLDALLCAMRAGDAKAAAPHFQNLFETVIEPLRPAVVRWKELLRANGALAAMMSGSGPAVWGLFADRAAAEDAAQVLRASGADAYVCAWQA
ncbi:MAG: 4-(cytidine 5'-diphospho)-2-C-methyl-D-erythritol kinase [Clostridia bacterium]|nr:4-(cytidine 5'-diphospho)-2-C-methyl-D-erythritol kinase [Clostridia bacterium]